MLLERVEVVSEHAEFVVQNSDRPLRLLKLAIERPDGSGLFGLYIQENMDLILHLISLPLKFLGQHLQLLVGKLFPSDLLGECRVVIS